MTTPSFMDRKREELRSRGIDPQRLPPGQYVTERFPVLHLGPVPQYPTLDGWTLTIDGDAIGRPHVLRWADLTARATSLTADIHCVTKWSKLDVRWSGARVVDLVDACAPSSSARTLVAHGESGYSATLPWHEVRARGAIVAWEVDGEPLSPEHGYPARLVVPHLYFWKSTKWLRRLELTTSPASGFWERNGYHEHGDPFREERYWGDAP